MSYYGHYSGNGSRHNNYRSYAPRKPRLTDEKTLRAVSELQELIELDASLKLDGSGQVFNGKDAEFAKSLCDGCTKNGGVTEKQLYWVEKLTAKALEDEPELRIVRKAAAIFDLFDNVSGKLKRPTFTIDGGAGPDLRLSLAGERAKVPGSINVTTNEGNYDSRKWFGRILRNGEWQESSRHPVTDAVFEAVERFSEDPEGEAARYGKKTGACCFCSRELSDDRSTEAGYGKTCAKNYGLHWGA